MNANIENNENEKVRSNLENQFQKLIPGEAPPDDLKEEVFNTLNSINLLADILDLFTLKFTQTEADFLDNLTDGNTEK